jgi:hypothetical protein
MRLDAELDSKNGLELVDRVRLRKKRCAATINLAG